MASIHPRDELLPQATRDALAHFARRRRKLRMVRCVAAGVVAMICAMSLVAIADYVWILSDAARLMFSLVGYALVASVVWITGFANSRGRDERRLAARMEAAEPRLREELVAAVELSQPDGENGSSGFRRWLQQRVATKLQEVDVKSLLPLSLIGRWLRAGTLLLTVGFLLLWIPNLQFGRRIARAMLPGVAIERASFAKIEILEPNPASGFVADGDTVGVVARIERSTDSTVIQWRSDDGRADTQPMHTRDREQTEGQAPSEGLRADADSVRLPPTIVAANVQVGQVPIEYRIISGDAITNWHRLVPRPRPKAVSFTKVVKYPDYARLPDAESTSEHGHIEAFVGSTVSLTVEFDQSLSESGFSTGNRAAARAMEPLGNDARRWQIDLPITIQSDYRILAVSADSGLDNRFGDSYTIRSLPDASPTVRWSSAMPTTMIRSPLGVVSLHAIARDDMVIESAAQEIQVNGGVVHKRSMAIPENAASLDLKWDWDLTFADEQSDEPVAINTGDIVRVRAAVTDRKGSEARTDWVEIYVVEDGFDPTRRGDLTGESSVLTAVAEWAAQVSDVTAQVQVALQQPLDAEDDLAAKFIGTDRLRLAASQLPGRVAALMTHAGSTDAADRLELIDRTIFEIDHRLAVIGGWRDDGVDPQVGVSEPIAWLDRTTGLSKTLERYALALISHQTLTVAMEEAHSLDQSLQQPSLVTSGSQLRTDRQLKVMVGRLKSINEILQSQTSGFADGARRAVEAWDFWSRGWIRRLGEESSTVNQQRERIEQFSAELAERIRNGLYDRRVASSMLRLGSELEQAIPTGGDLAAELSTRWGNSGDSAAATESKETLLKRLDDERWLHRRHPRVDLQYASDIGLMRRAVEAVTTGDGTSRAKAETAQIVERLAHAFDQLYACHLAVQAEAKIGELQLREQAGVSVIQRRFSHPLWVEQFVDDFDRAMERLEDSLVDRQQLAPMQTLLDSRQLRRLRDRISSRRRDADRTVSVEPLLAEIHPDRVAAISAIRNIASSARATIASYVRSLSEQARHTAALAGQAKSAAEQATSDREQGFSSFVDQQRKTEAASIETMQLLADLANTRSITEPSARQLAYDADAALRLLQAALAEAAMQSRQAMRDLDNPNSEQQFLEASQSLGELEETLERIGEHFRRAESGEPLAESREALRVQARELDQSGDLQTQVQQSEQLASDANQGSREMLERLEASAQRDPSMRDELSDIAERLARDALDRLWQSAADELAVGNAIEQSDPVFSERKRRLVDTTQTVVHRLSSLNRAYADLVERGLEAASARGTRSDPQRAFRLIREAVETLDRELESSQGLEQIKAASQSFRTQIRSAIELADVAIDGNQERMKRNLPDVRQRVLKQREGDRLLRDVRDLGVREVTNRRRRWSTMQREATKRLQQARRMREDYQQQRQQLEASTPQSAPADRDARIAQAEGRVAVADALIDTIGETRKLAGERIKDLDRRVNRTPVRVIEPLTEANPTSEAVMRIVEHWKEVANDVDQMLNELDPQVNFAGQLRLDASSAKRLAAQQSQVVRDIDDAVTQLRRAARHEARLTREEAAAKLRAAADGVRERASLSAAEASSQLEKVAGDSAETPRASQLVNIARSEIESAASELQRVLDMLSRERSDGEASTGGQGRGRQDAGRQDAGRPNAGRQDTEATRSGLSSRQMAQTLDELDRTESESSPTQRSAAERSPTLQQEIREQSRSAANVRQQTVASAQRSEQSAQNPSSDSGVDGPGDTGQGSDDDSRWVDTSGVDREGLQWGQLRERNADEMTQSASEARFPRFQRQIDAYFRAVARQAAASDE